MNKGEIRTEVEARGYDYVGTSRLNLWIDQAHQYVCSQEPWPFLETFTTDGTAPLEIADLSQILHVSIGGNTIDGMDIRDVLDSDPGITATGTPSGWYIRGNTELHVWPQSEDATLAISYVKQAAALGEDESPLFPPEFHELVIDGAVARGLKDNDEYDTAAALMATIDAGIQDMREQLLVRNYQNQQIVMQTRPVGDYSA